MYEFDKSELNDFIEKRKKLDPMELYKIPDEEMRQLQYNFVREMAIKECIEVIEKIMGKDGSHGYDHEYYCCIEDAIEELEALLK